MRCNTIQIRLCCILERFAARCYWNAPPLAVNLVAKSVVFPSSLKLRHSSYLSDVNAFFHRSYSPIGFLPVTIEEGVVMPVLYRKPSLLIPAFWHGTSSARTLRRRCGWNTNTRHFDIDLLRKHFCLFSLTQCRFGDRGLLEEVEPGPFRVEKSPKLLTNSDSLNQFWANFFYFSSFLFS